MMRSDRAEAPMRTRITLALVALLAVAAHADARGGGRGGGQDTMQAGDVAFAVELCSVDGKSSFHPAETGGKPVALVFGSYT